MKCLNGGYWNLKTEKCLCNYRWKGKNCTKWRNHYCYFNNGFEYRGFLSQTKTGGSCAPWTSDQNGLYPVGENGIGPHNFCRNPGNESKGLWCYVTNSNFFEYCNITKCPDSLIIDHKLSEMEKDTSETTVTFLYGPLIIGLCAGMISLILIIVLADCIRKKKICLHQKNVKVSKSETDDKNVDPEPIKEDQKPDSQTDEDIDSCTVLGGVVTVNVDTGEYKRQHQPEKNFSKEKQIAANRQTLSQYDNSSVASCNQNISRYKKKGGRRKIKEETMSLPSDMKLAYKYKNMHILPETSI